jgi:hypothetical protein
VIGKLSQYSIVPFVYINRLTNHLHVTTPIIGGTILDRGRERRERRERRHWRHRQVEVVDPTRSQSRTSNLIQTYILVTKLSFACFRLMNSLQVQSTRQVHLKTQSDGANIGSPQTAARPHGQLSEKAISFPSIVFPATSFRCVRMERVWRSQAACINRP